MDIFGPVSIYDVIYAAVAAFPITFLITRMGKGSGESKPQTPPKKWPSNWDGGEEEYPESRRAERTEQPVPANPTAPPQLRGSEGEAFLAQCRELFPITSFRFGNTVFERGDYIQLVTLQQRLIEGELIGQNDQRVICIRTRQNVIAQKMDRIERMRKTDKPVGF